MDELSKNLNQVLLHAFGKTKDLVAVYDNNDILSYCNDSFANTVGLSKEKLVGLSFSDLIRCCYKQKQGLLVETDNVECWLQIANEKRRSMPFRTFEIDIIDGRWIKMTEQLVDDYIVLIGVDITPNKSLQFELEATQKKLHEAASTDFMTGIYNRRYFTKIAESEIARCSRNQTKLTLLLFDLDYFKDINDRYGHTAGDNVIIEFATRIKTCMRKYDIFARFGGEEFALLLPDTDSIKGHEVARRCLLAINSSPVIYDGQSINVTVSIGLTDTLSKNGCLDQLLKSADKNLYAAKTQGRNQVVGP